MVYFSMYLVLPLLIYGGLSENIFLFSDCTMWDAFHCRPLVYNQISLAAFRARCISFQPPFFLKSYKYITHDVLQCKDTNINIIYKLFDINFNIIFPVTEGRCKIKKPLYNK